ncbi:MAG: HAD-IA family hydrolase [Pseudomonadota bacterium]
MPIKYTHIIFDWDGTLMDSSAKIVQCMQLAAEDINLEPPTSEQVKEIIGISLVPAIQRLFDVDDKTSATIAKHYKTHYLERDQTPCPLFPGVVSTLSVLQHEMTLAVATGKARRGLERAWQMTNSSHYFSDSICSDEAESKPSPDMLIQLLERWQVDVSKTLMVGDTIYDMQMAEALSMPRIAVTFGAHDAERLKQYSPLATIDAIHELKDVVGL